MRRTTLLALFLVSVLLRPIQGQNPTGTISGTVVDAAGAVTPGVEISIVNLGTGLARTTVTNQAGEYSVPVLPVGHYQITASLRGFKTAVVSDLKLNVQETVRVPIALELGELNESIDVSSRVPSLETETSAVGEVITNEQVTNLPLNVRNFVQLTFLSPFAIGATRDFRSGEVNRGTPVPSTGGQRPEDNNYQIDGFDNLEGGRHNYSVAAPVDSVAEFRVQSGVAPAEFGRSAGTVINVVTKSGSNEFHGTLYEFFRNDAFDARNFFASQVSPLKRNQFGVSAGGPAIRKKLLLFGNYEGYRERRAGSPVVGQVPTLLERQGQFEQVVFDPLNNNQPFPGNRIPESRFSSTSKALLALWPTPNTNDIKARNFRFDRPAVPITRDTLTARADYIIGPKDNVYIRYVRNDDESRNPPRFPNGIGGTVFNLKASTLGGHYNRVFSPSIVNDLGFGWTRYQNSNFNFLSYGEDIHTKVGITNVISAVEPVFTGSPVASIPGYLGLGESTPNDRRTSTYELTDHLSWARGSHRIKVGGSFRWSETKMRFSSGASSHTFANRYSGDNFADFLLGLPSQAFKTGRRTFWDSQLPYFALFIQDDWKVNPRLTLNLGIRYEVEGAFRTPRHDQIGFNPGTGEMLLSEGIADRQMFESFFRDVRPDVRIRFVPQDVPYDADTDNFAPRIGLAYQLRQRMVIRAGYGINYAAPQLPSLASANDFVPNALTANWTGDPARPVFTLPDRSTIPVAWNPEGTSSFEATVAYPTTLGLGGPFVQRDFPYAMNQQWTVDLQTQITSNLMFESTYLGSRGAHLLGFMNINFTDAAPGAVQPRLPFPSYSFIHTPQPRNNAYYHGLGLKLEQRLNNGLMLLGSYTFSKSLDTVSTFNSFAQWTDPRNQLGSARGHSDFDAPHRFVASFAYELPLGRGKKWGNSWSGATNHLLGGWSVRGITQFQSGFFYSPGMALARSNYCAAVCVARADRIGDGNLGSGSRTLNAYWDRTAFVVPTTAAPRSGNAGRNILQGPGVNNWDLGISKQFEIREATRIEFRYEMFNAFNHPQFGAPGASADAANFGVISSAADPRISQFVLKVIW